MLEHLRKLLRAELRRGDMPQAWFIAGIIVLFRMTEGQTLNGRNPAK